MPINIYILSSSKDLKSFTKGIKSVVKSVELSIKKLIPLGDIDVVFYDNPEATLKESGIGGYTPCANIIFFSLDPRNPNFKQGLKKELSFQLAHEINHAIRFRTPITKETLFEAMISEGLADHFAMEITGQKIPPAWSTALTDEQKKEFFKKSSEEWNLPTYNHNAWFYGSEIKKIPRWTAYTLGYDLVANYLRKNPKIKSSKIISAETSIFA